MQLNDTIGQTGTMLRQVIGEDVTMVTLPSVSKRSPPISLPCGAVTSR